MTSDHCNLISLLTQKTSNKADNPESCLGSRKERVQTCFTEVAEGTQSEGPESNLNMFTLSSSKNNQHKRVRMREVVREESQS